MAGKRVTLASLAQKAEPTEAPEQLQPEPEPDPAPAPPRIGAVETVEQPELRPEPVAKPSRPKKSPAGSKEPKPGEWVRYDQYERKEARLRADQYGELSNVSRRLNRARNGNGERITENTLIRVAIDLLLSREGDLAGATEAELRKSVGL